MTFALVQTLASSFAIFATAVCLWLWQILSAPDRPNYPTSGPIKRTLMFLLAAGLAYRSIEILYLAQGPTAFRVTDGQALTSWLMLGLFSTFLVDHLLHWLPAKTHSNIRRLMAVARCRPRRELIQARTAAMAASTGEPCPSADVVGPALAELSLQGMAVLGPGAAPAAVTGADQ